MEQLVLAAYGVSVSGVQTQLRTDEVGRMKISHAQPPATSVDLTAVGNAIAVPMDSLSDLIFYFRNGTAHTGFNLTFEQSPDSTDGVDGNWFPVLGKNQGAVAAVATTTGVLTTSAASSFHVSAPGAAWVRARVTARTSGTLAAMASGTTAARPTDLTVAGSVGVSGTVTAAPGASSEQAETTTNLAANATYTGTSRDLGTTAAARPTLVRPVIMHTAGLTPGTLILQESTDGSAWRETRRTPIPSDSSYRSFEFPVHMRYYRFLFTNGATAQTGFYLHASRIQGDGGTMDAKNNLSFLLSTTAVAANGTFTSPTLDLGDNHIWDTVRLRVHTDQASATDGIRIESSHDGTNWGYSQAAAITKSADARIVSLERPVTERYIRLVVANGATLQGFLRATLALVSL